MLHLTTGPPSLNPRRPGDHVIHIDRSSLR